MCLSWCFPIQSQSQQHPENSVHFPSLGLGPIRHVRELGNSSFYIRICVHAPELFRTWTLKIMTVKLISLLPKQFYSLFWNQWKVGRFLFCLLQFRWLHSEPSVWVRRGKALSRSGQLSCTAKSRSVRSAESVLQALRKFWSLKCNIPPSSPKPLRTALALKSIGGVFVRTAGSKINAQSLNIDYKCSADSSDLLLTSSYNLN